jgi:hypothetical protein
VRDVLPALPNDMTAVTDFRGRVAHNPDPVDPVARVSASAVHTAVVQVQSARELRLDVLGTEDFDALLSGPPLFAGHSTFGTSLDIGSCTAAVAQRRHLLSPRAT